MVTRPITKKEILETVGELPEEATVEDAMERLYFLAKVERGLDEAAGGEGIPHEEIRKRFQR